MNNKINIENDCIFNMEKYFIRKTKIGKFGICELPEQEFKNKILSCKKNIFLYTKYKEILWLKNKKTFIIECDNNVINAWLCKILTFEQFLEVYSNKDIFSESTKSDYENKESIEAINIIYGRCVNSMTFLDKVYREHLYKHKFKDNEIIAVKSVAGSGKTTTLLELAKIHKKKKILYIAFNKSLITEIRDKIQEQKINNLIPITFDALMRDVFIKKTSMEHIDIVDLKPQTLPFFIEWFGNKPYRIKNFYVKSFNKFCNQTKYSDIKEFSKKVLNGEKKLLNNMWQKALDHDLITFDSIRKLVEINKWCKGYIDSKYDMIFIDESQDFDNTMLKILLEDTTIPKLFVGDTRQAIYEWKGCINAFDKLPKETLILEFYSTFRVGEPACSLVREKFDNCNMISRSTNLTILDYDIIPTEKYTYLFRNWRNLLETASTIEKIWIHNFSSQIEYIKRLHSKLKISKLDEDELSEFSDDLPKFLLKMSAEELEKLINNIEKNIVKKEDANVELYTIHSYKGLEDNIVRIFNDIDLNKEKNLYYVALTRGKKQIIIDTKKPMYEIETNNKKQLFFKTVGNNCIILE